MSLVNDTTITFNMNGEVVDPGENTFCDYGEKMNNFKKNMSELKKVNGLTWSFIEKEKKTPEWYKPIKSKSGEINFLISNGAEVHPAYDTKKPTKEAITTAKGMKEALHNRSLTILVGIGCGHTLNQLLKQKEKEHRILVIEPVVQMYKTAFSEYDFSKSIEDGRLIFSHSNTHANYMFGLIESTWILESMSMIAEGYIMLRPVEYLQLSIYISSRVNQMRCNIGTVMGAGGKIAENDIRNLPYVLHKRGVNDIENLYKGKPAVCVSTGPSLSKNIRFLMDKNVRKKVVVIAVAQALRILLAYDIVPDFITSVDYGIINYDHFRGLFDLGEKYQIPLVAVNRVYDKILAEWKAPVFIAANSAEKEDPTATGILADKGTLEQGGSVSHLSLGLAIKLGCNPITLIGQDLAYEGDKSHFAQADASGSIKVDKSGLITWTVKDPNSPLSKKGDHSMGTGVPVPGFFGGIVMTNTGLASFITSFEGIVARYPKIDFYNSTEGGASIRGMKKLVLRNFLEKFCKKEIVKKVIFGLAENGDELAEKSIKIFESDIKNLKKLIEHCDEGLISNKEILEADKATERFKALGRNEKSAIAAHNCAKMSPLVALSIYSESRAIFSKKFDAKNKTTKSLAKDKNVKDREIMCAKNRLILEAARKSAKELLPMYEDAKKMIEKYLKTKSFIESGIWLDAEKEYFLNDSKTYFKNGNFAFPMLQARRYIEQTKASKRTFFKLRKAKRILFKSIQMRNEQIEKSKLIKTDQQVIDYYDLIEQSRVVIAEKDGLKKSSALIKKALKISDGKMEAVYGWATVLHLQGKHKESVKYYQKLIDGSDSNPVLIFEQGKAMLHYDIDNGIKRIKEAMKMTKQFDSFFARLGELYEKGGDLKTAVDCYEQYLKRHPANYQIMEQLARCYQELDSMSKAQKLRKKIKELVGD